MTDKIYTAAIVSSLITQQIESDFPDQILEIIKRNDGKLLTKRFLSQLPGGEERWHITQVANMTNLRERIHSQTSGNKGYSFLLAHGTKNIHLNAQEFELNNLASFYARRARNHLRMEAANDADACKKMAAVLNKFIAAKKEYKAAESELIKLTGYAQPFSPDRFFWGELATNDE